MILNALFPHRANTEPFRSHAALFRRRGTLVPTLCGLSLIAAILCGSFAIAFAATDDAAPKTSPKPSYEQSRTEKGRILQITRGKAEIIKANHQIADVIIANPDIVDARALKSNHLSLIGLALGSTNVLLLDENGNLVQSLNVQVSIDETGLRSAIKSLYPNEKITVETLNDNVILGGSVSSAANAAAIRDLALRFAAGEDDIVNMMDVAGEQQVMIKVRVLEVSRSILNELGVETEYTGGLFNGEGSTALGITDGLGLTIDPSYAIGSFTYANGGVGPLNVLIRALERDGMVNTLAEPNLTAVSGENARFLAGGEYPIPTSRDRDGNIVYEYKPFGVSLSFKPIVLANDRINLQILTEVSEISTEQLLQLPGITVPPFTVRRAETTVELASGGSLVLAGLIESQALRTMNQVPGLKNIPIIGDLIASESFQRNESELLVMMTAYTVKPFAKSAVTADMTTAASAIPSDDGRAVNGHAVNESTLTTILHERLIANAGYASGESPANIRNVRYILD